ncbi:MAG: DUF58 domain-containing protein [Oleiphilus sp.]
MFISLEKLSQWISSKSPRQKIFHLSQRNIYIFPSALGAGFLVMLAVMLLTAINYQNSLIYLLSFFLGTLFFLSIWMCFLNLAGLAVEAKEPGRCFAGEPSQFNLRLSKLKGLPLALKVGLNKDDARLVPFSDHDCVDLTVVGKKCPRGRHGIHRLYIESRFPFGLVKTWTWLKLDAECWVYPEPDFAEANASSNGEGGNADMALPSSDLNELREYQHGDSTKRILWKKFAAKDELIVRDVDLGCISPDWVDWAHYSDPVEARLKHLCFDVCQLSEKGQPFGFKIPGRSIPPNVGAAHKQSCLDALALFNQ